MNVASNVEALRLIHQQQLDANLSPRERNKSGQFATPSELAEQIARYTIDLLEGRHAPINFLEPSLGTGAFYSALMRVSANLARAVGIELDHATAQVAGDLWQSFGLEVREGDFTTLEFAPDFDLILANPPYVRHHHLSAEQKADLRQRVHAQLGYTVNGLAGLYCYFILLADRSLAQHGIGAWLIPSEFMDVNYGEVLRRYLTERVTLLRVHRFHAADVQFEDALVSSVVIVYEKRQPAPDHLVESTLGGTLEKPEQSTYVNISHLRTSSKWSQVTSAKASASSNKPYVPRFEDVFAIKRGIATGANEFFILPRDEATKLGLPDQYLRPILPGPRYLTGDVITANADGFPNLSPQRVLIDCQLSAEEIRSQYPALWRYLETGKAAGLDKRYLTSRRNPWYRQEQREVAPFLCTYMGRSQHGRQPFRFIWNQSQAVAPNVYLLMYPVGELAIQLSTDPTLYGAIYNLLNTLDVDALISEGRTYGGALHKIEPSELGKVPLVGFEQFIYPIKQMTLF